VSLELNPLRVGGKLPLQILNIAHRGARAFAPENTLPAFEKAKTFGCQMFELDVHMSKDGELVVYHDDELTRCTDVEAKFPGRSSHYVSDFTYDELLKLDAGSWYAEQLLLPPPQRQFFLQTLTDEETTQFVSPEDRELYASGDIKLPTLRQALEVAVATDMMINIEIKSIPRMYSGLTEAVVQLVEAMGLDRRILISSFDHEQLVEVRRLSNIIATGVLTSDRLAKPGDYLQLLDSDAYNPGCYGDYDSMGFGSVSRKLDPRGIMNVRAAGRGVNVWTCNDKHQMRELIAAGVTGLITDFPNRVRDVCAANSPPRRCQRAPDAQPCRGA
jgi:glycerophosphoryl diester phosphodiesterase